MRLTENRVLMISPLVVEDDAYHRQQAVNQQGDTLKRIILSDLGHVPRPIACGDYTLPQASWAVKLIKTTGLVICSGVLL